MTTAATSHEARYRWSDLPAEPVQGTITRRLNTSEWMMIAHVPLKTR